MREWGILLKEFPVETSGLQKFFSRVNLKGIQRLIHSRPWEPGSPLADNIT